ncbi:hypothetical protein [Capnocytophaga sputigena]|uniref:hypothetical protein n=1 Tax=Capnocytophaga sputigena TaxID=1019 RepID=UPI0028F03E1A|nr:hypothetical protein [Capnocytophaga sputigena]
MPKLPAYTARIFGKVFYPPIAPTSPIAPTPPIIPTAPIPPTIARTARTSHNSYFSPPLSPSHFANSLIIPTFALCKEYSP